MTSGDGLLSHPIHNMGAVNETTTPIDEGAPPPAAPDVTPDPPAASAEATPETPAKLELTQAELDKIVEKRLARERQKFEAEQAQAAKRAKMDEAERLKAEKADAEKADAEALSQADARIRKAEAKLAAAAAGVDPKRVDAFLRIVDLDEVAVTDGDVDAAALSAAIAKGLADVPEFKGNGAPPRAGGDFTESGTPKVWTREEIAKLSVDEYQRHEAEIMAQLQGAGIR